MRMHAARTAIALAPGLALVVYATDTSRIALAAVHLKLQVLHRAELMASAVVAATPT
ncbi:hypothetical protein [Streptomyces sp. NPDC048272]|uniref:hypothetical protein n=1 Tax=Streptomyces sp. NPDC048272 TaxID=3154616 RepID=UPI0034196C69